jgi:hypothetical protein
MWGVVGNEIGSMKRNGGEREIRLVRSDVEVVRGGK